MKKFRRKRIKMKVILIIYNINEKMKEKLINMNNKEIIENLK